MIDAIPAIRTKVADRRTAAGSRPYPCLQDTADEFESIPVDGHRQAEGAGRQLLTVNAMTHERDDRRLCDLISNRAALAISSKVFLHARLLRLAI